MKLNFDYSLAKKYKSPSQIIRVLSEGWLKSNGYCPNCGESSLHDFIANKPVADFHCSKCAEQFELKSKSGLLGNKINDGAYRTMIERITSDNNPNFFFLTYNRSNWSVNNALIIPKHFFIKDIIERRKPLNQSSQRAGWVGCNIDLRQIPSYGRIFLVKESKAIRKDDVLKKWNETLFLKDVKKEAKGWTIDVMNCIDRIHGNDFSLSDMKRFENELSRKHPNNNFVAAKIRQQLQILRDRGILKFTSRGNYRKI